MRLCQNMAAITWFSLRTLTGHTRRVHDTELISRARLILVGRLTTIAATCDPRAGTAISQTLPLVAHVLEGRCVVVVAVLVLMSRLWNTQILIFIASGDLTLWLPDNEFTVARLAETLACEALFIHGTEVLVTARIVLTYWIGGTDVVFLIASRQLALRFLDGMVAVRGIHPHARTLQADLSNDTESSVVTATVVIDGTAAVAAFIGCIASAIQQYVSQIE